MRHTTARTRRAVQRLTNPPHTAQQAPGHLAHTARPAPGHPAHARRGPRLRGYARRAVVWLTARVQESLKDAARRPDRGDVSITTVIIWVAAVTGALVVAGTIAVVVGKYNGLLNNL
ncbi:hypothetical protein [Streptomyces sp. WAC 01325]|uniref:hypothetical protein n=1 Tax=Streptomyces sp. WAC 01325 TaxID=2203202 RepID=UPI002691AB8E|nr:hypothetical protein [Streptomyces sp. WAC 01325]